MHKVAVRYQSIRGHRETNLPGAEGSRSDINPLGGHRETNLPGAEGSRSDINPLGGHRETNLPGAEGSRSDINPLGGQCGSTCYGIAAVAQISIH
ncbi:hypothetical protein M8286_10195 [Streptococcus suis]|uniref:hypothetical protein n=1 Tax=Streptococcus suis TaxID=1307 RepID=UPI0030E04FBE